jgi:hypothetical protein
MVESRITVPLRVMAWLMLSALTMPGQCAESTAASPSSAPPTADQRRAGTPTDVVVRVRARDAKLITTDMSVLVILHDADTGEELARGVTMGLKDGADPAMTAAFRTTLHLTAPRRVTATARGPLSYPHAQVDVSSTQWLLPGRHLQGQGWVLEMPGFVVTLDDTAVRAGRIAGQAQLRVRARVVLMCGCATAPGTRWDSDRYEIRGQLRYQGQLVAEQPLVFAGEESTYEGTLLARDGGPYELLVYAWDAVTGNTGVARVDIDMSVPGDGG